MGTWKNNDGLYIKTGTTKATATTAGEYVTEGAMREVEIKLDLTALTETETIQSDSVFIPTGVRIQEIVVIAETAAATGTAIDLGLIRSSDRSTEYDYNGLLAAFPTGSMNAAGEQTTLTVGSTYAGALIGATTATYPTHISCSRTDATAFTAGSIIVKIRYYKP